MPKDGMRGRLRRVPCEMIGRFASPVTTANRSRMFCALKRLYTSTNRDTRPLFVSMNRVQRASTRWYADARSEYSAPAECDVNKLAVVPDRSVSTCTTCGVYGHPLWTRPDPESRTGLVPGSNAQSNRAARGGSPGRGMREPWMTCVAEDSTYATDQSTRR